MITEEILREELAKGKSLTQIARERRYSVGYLSHLCKKYGLKAPRPGRKAGYKHTEEEKERLSEAAYRRQNEG